MWNKIVNPKTGRKVNVNSKIGKNVLRNYIKQLGGAEANTTELECIHETKNDCKNDFHLCKINNILELNKIPLKINIMQYSDLLNYNLENAYSFDDDEDNIYVVLINSKNNDLVAFTILNISEKCLYINYQFVDNKYRSLSIGVFLGFLAIYMGINLHKNYVFAFGVKSGDDQLVDSPYERKLDGYNHNKWILSQAILVNKFGFYDGHKLDTDKKLDERKLQHIYTTCGDYAETWLDLQNNIEKYQKYMDNFVNNPKKTLFKYINSVESEGSI